MKIWSTKLLYYNDLLTLQFALFNSEAFYEIMNSADPRYLATYAKKLTDINLPGQEFSQKGLIAGSRIQALNQAEGAAVAVAGTSTSPFGTVGPSETTYSLTGGSASTENMWEIGIAEAPCEFPDQILPFDVTMIAANEAGQQAVSRVFGMELLNMGLSISTDDIDIVETYTYIAQYYQGFQPIYWDANTMAEDTFNRLLNFGSNVLGQTSGVGGIPGQETVTWGEFLNE